MAAGKGKRMGGDVPKPLVEIAGQPMVRHLLDSVKDSGLDSRPIIIVAPDNLKQFHEVCNSQECEYCLQEEQLGTGHAVMSAKDVAQGADNLIVLYGDHPFISAEKIQELNDLHKSRGAVISMITSKVPNFQGKYAHFERWGRIIRDASKRVVAIREAKDATVAELEITEINPALFAFNAEWLWEHLPEIKNKNASGEYYLTDLIEMAIEEGYEIVTAPAAPLEVVGVNSREELEAAEELFG